MADGLEAAVNCLVAGELKIDEISIWSRVFGDDYGPFGGWPSSVDATADDAADDTDDAVDDADDGDDDRAADDETDLAERARQIGEWHLAAHSRDRQQV